MRKWVFGKFEDIIGRSVFRQTFEWFDPSSVGVTHERIWGEILIMLETCFYVCQITGYIVRITKIYSLSYRGVWLRRYRWKVIQRSRGSNFQRPPICMKDISSCSSGLVHFKIAYFYYFLTFIFEMITFKRIRTVIFEQEVLMCKLLIFYDIKSIKQIIPICAPNVSYNKHTLTLKIWLQYDKIWVATLNHFSQNCLM